MAAVGKGHGVVLIANLSKSSVPLKMECKGMKVKTVRLIDNNRTDVRIPMLAALPPLSILQIKCSAEKSDRLLRLFTFFFANQGAPLDVKSRVTSNGRFEWNML